MEETLLCFSPNIDCQSVSLFQNSITLLSNNMMFVYDWTTKNFVYSLSFENRLESIEQTASTILIGDSSGMIHFISERAIQGQSRISNFSLKYMKIGSIQQVEDCEQLQCLIVDSYGHSFQVIINDHCLQYLQKTNYLSEENKIISVLYINNSFCQFYKAG